MDIGTSYKQSATALFDVEVVAPPHVGAKQIQGGPGTCAGAPHACQCSWAATLIFAASLAILSDTLCRRCYSSLLYRPPANQARAAQKCWGLVQSSIQHACIDTRPSEAQTTLLCPSWPFSHNMAGYAERTSQSALMKQCTPNALGAARCAADGDPQLNSHLKLICNRRCSHSYLELVHAWGVCIIKVGSSRCQFAVLH